MSRLAVPLSILAAALVGCASQQRQPAPAPSVAQKAPKIVAQELPFQPGIGVIVAAAPRPAPISAGAGATRATNPRAATTSPDTMRLTLRMDNGKTQYVDMTTSEYQREFRVGQRVELSRDGFMKALP